MSQPSRILTGNGLEVPPDFPIAPYEAIFRAVRTRSADLALWHVFSGAWNAVSIRFLAAAHYADTFREAALRYGIGSSQPLRYEEERAIFGFFANVMSSMDAAYYGLFAIGAFLSPSDFPLVTPEDQERVTRRRAIAAYARTFPGDPIVAALSGVQADGAFICLGKIRNVLVHRAVPGRKIYLSAGSGAREQPDEWNLLGIPLTPDTLAIHRVGLARLLGELLEPAACLSLGTSKLGSS